MLSAAIPFEVSWGPTGKVVRTFTLLGKKTGEVSEALDPRAMGRGRSAERTILLSITMTMS